MGVGLIASRSLSVIDGLSLNMILTLLSVVPFGISGASGESGASQWMHAVEGRWSSVLSFRDPCSVPSAMALLGSLLRSRDLPLARPRRGIGVSLQVLVRGQPASSVLRLANLGRSERVSQVQRRS